MFVTRKSLVVLVAVVGLGIWPTSPAHAAAHNSNAAFTGTFITNPALYSPVSPACGAGLCPAPAGGAWVLIASGDGISTSVTPTSISGPLFTISGTGSLGKVGGFGPYCGFFSGSGTFNWSFSGALDAGGGGHHGSFTAHWLASPGGRVVLTSGDVRVEFTVVDPSPATGGGSCLAGTATNFPVVDGSFSATTA